jgi:hypothetical protein
MACVRVVKVRFADTTGAGLAWHQREHIGTAGRALRWKGDSAKGRSRLTCIIRHAVIILDFLDEDDIWALQVIHDLLGDVGKVL